MIYFNALLSYRRCDYIISAFGSGLYSEDIKSALEPVKLNRWGTPEVDNTDMSTR